MMPSARSLYRRPLHSLGRARRTWLSLAALGPMFSVGCAHGARAQEPHEASHQAAQHNDQAPGDRDAFRNTAPASEPLLALHLPIAEVVTLDNGLNLWIYPKRDLPLVQVVALIKSGSAQDPKGQEGLASLTAEVMRRGTRSRTAQAIALEVENLGSEIDASVMDDATFLQVGALTENIGPVLDVLVDVLLHPAFDRGEFERAQKQHLTQLVQIESMPQACAQTVFRKVVFGGHPYGSNGMGTAKSVRGLHPHSAAQFWAKHVRPHNTHIIIVGDVSVEEAKAMVAQRLGDWRGAKGEQKAPALPRPQPREIALVHRPGPKQSQLAMGGLGLSRGTDDYFAAVLANSVLSGQFTSRLNMNLREDKGWTYGVRSSFSFLRAPGPYSINTSIRADATVDGITEILKEVERMRHEDISSAELTDAKNAFILSQPANFESLGRIAQMFGSLALHELPATFYRDLPTASAEVTTQDIRQVMHKYVVPEQMSIVVVGDATKLQRPLEALKHGPVHVRDGEGKMVAWPKSKAQP